MSHISHLEPEFVEFIPTDPKPGKLYISIPYTTTVHLCASGCGNKITLPLSPAQWHLFFNGETVSLSPSVGNWDLPCRSHYWIRNNTIQWAAQWSDKQIKAGRQQDIRDINTHHKKVTSRPPRSRKNASQLSWWVRLFKR